MQITFKFTLILQSYMAFPVHQESWAKTSHCSLSHLESLNHMVGMDIRATECNSPGPDGGFTTPREISIQPLLLQHPGQLVLLSYHS